MFAHEAVELYERARFRGWWHRLAARLRGKPVRLFDLSALTAGRALGARHDLGARTVPLAQIRGSEGRRDLFDDAFYPLDGRSRQRWLGIATTWLRGVTLPPVELIRVDESYVVRDGHHRISVIRALNIPEVEAVVTAWDLAPAPSTGQSVAGSGDMPAYRMGGAEPKRSGRSGAC